MNVIMTIVFKGTVTHTDIKPLFPVFSLFMCFLCLCVKLVLKSFSPHKHIIQIITCVDDDKTANVYSNKNIIIISLFMYLFILFYFIFIYFIFFFFFAISSCAHANIWNLFRVSTGACWIHTYQVCHSNPHRLKVMAENTFAHARMRVLCMCLGPPSGVGEDPCKISWKSVQ